MGPLLAICVPTYNRASELSRLLECLDREVAAVDDVVVLVSDNASQDDTAELLAAATATRPWLRAHRQVENIGAPGNIEWLVDNAPDADYAWIFCDDDVLVPGALDTARALLLTERPTWLFLPHQLGRRGRQRGRRVARARHGRALRNGPRPVSGVPSFG